MIKVYIDPGHGGKDSGAINGIYQEKDIALNVGLKLKQKLLSTNKFDVKMSRESDIFISLEHRTNEANEWGADIFISIHCNDSDNKSALGVETYCYKFKYRKLADFIQKSILDNNLCNKDREVKEGNLHVIRESNMSACLVELGFISNDADLHILLNKQEQLANALYQGILNYFDISINDNPPKAVEGYYRVIVDSCKNKEYAIEKQKELKEKGFDSFLSYYEG